jgi:hypothetical protein
MMNVLNGLHNKAKRVAFGVGVGALLTIPVATMISSTAGADSTCYSGCSAPSIGLPTTSGGDGSATAVSSTPTTTSSPAGLAFTGADLSELVIISLGALGGGTVLVRYSRRRKVA